MKYRIHFIFMILIFAAILFAGLFLDNQPFNGTNYSYIQYTRPVGIDVCSQTVAVGMAGQYESQGCNQLVNHDANYYYYGTVNSYSGQYVPYIQ